MDTKKFQQLMKVEENRTIIFSALQIYQDNFRKSSLNHTDAYQDVILRLEVIMNVLFDRQGGN